MAFLNEHKFAEKGDSGYISLNVLEELSRSVLTSNTARVWTSRTPFFQLCLITSHGTDSELASAMPYVCTFYSHPSRAYRYVWLALISQHSYKEKSAHLHDKHIEA